jgi:hypothetical protein
MTPDPRLAAAQCIRRYEGADGFRRCRRRAKIRFVPEFPIQAVGPWVLCERHDRPTPEGYVRRIIEETP